MMVWRPMGAGDIAAVAAISDTVHGRYTERPAVYAERLLLYPAGCWLLEEEGAALGYLVGHPWRDGQVPALDAFVGAIPANADVYYLHDLALLPQARGTGAAVDAVRLSVNQARIAGFARIALTAVNGADAFWRRHGFAPALSSSAAAYGETSIFMVRPVGDG